MRVAVGRGIPASAAHAWVGWQPLPEIELWRLDSYHFDPRSLPLEDTELAALGMFKGLGESSRLGKGGGRARLRMWPWPWLTACRNPPSGTGFMETYRIPYPQLCRWLLSVKKNYRPGANRALRQRGWPCALMWCSGLIWQSPTTIGSTPSVLRSACTPCCKIPPWKRTSPPGIAVGNDRFVRRVPARVKALPAVRLRHLSQLEKLALFVGCLCHDLDHRQASACWLPGQARKPLNRAGR